MFDDDYTLYDLYYIYLCIYLYYIHLMRFSYPYYESKSVYFSMTGASKGAFNNFRKLLLGPQSLKVGYSFYKSYLAEWNFVGDHI